MSRNYAIAGALCLTLIAVVRIVRSYPATPQGFDEPCHAAAGLELLQRHTYRLDPIHPPLSRLTIGIPLYAAGVRYPQFAPGDAGADNYNVVGNRILFDGGHYLRNLALARVGVLPWLLGVTLLVFRWTRGLFGDTAALAAIAFLLSLPIMLAFGGLAYTDMTAACTQCWALLAFGAWLEKRDGRRTACLGLALGFALLSKFTSLIFVPAAAIVILLVRWSSLLRRRAVPAAVPEKRWLQVGLVILIAGAVLWAGYGFSFGHVQEDLGLSPKSMPTFQHFPHTVGVIARQMVMRDALVPVPALLRGLASTWVLNQSAPPSYLLGRIHQGGWWYFFLVGVAVKTPLPLLALAVVGAVVMIRRAREGDWQAATPMAAITGILIVTMPVKYDAGVRHVLVVFPLLAIVAAAGFDDLWKARKTEAGRRAGQLGALFLLGWLAIASFRAEPDHLAYFNELAGKDPSRVLVLGCDLDCGQDVFRLREALREREVSHFHLAVWSSAEMTKLGLPDFEVLQPFQPVTGWIAISSRSQRFGDVLHTTYPEGAFAWLSAYQPVARVGSTILLYDIPPGAGNGP